MKALIASGSLEKSPEAIAAFLRKHIGDLDKQQLGEYLGHHDELEVCLTAPASQRLLISYANGSDIIDRLHALASAAPASSDCCRRSASASASCTDTSKLRWL